MSSKALPKFYVGQKVVAIENYFDLVKGKEYRITGVYKNCSCHFAVTVGVPSNGVGGYCHICKKSFYSKMERQFSENRFAPKEEIADFQAITFEKVIEKELASVN